MSKATRLILGVIATLLVGAIALHAGMFLLKSGSEAITNVQLAERIEAGDVYVVDVRSAEDYAKGHIPGVKNIPHAEFEDRLEEIPSELPVVVTCYRGMLNRIDAGRLEDAGHTEVYRVDNGMRGWEGELEKGEPR